MPSLEILSKLCDAELAADEDWRTGAFGKIALEYWKHGQRDKARELVTSTSGAISSKTWLRRATFLILEPPVVGHLINFEASVQLDLLADFRNKPDLSTVSVQERPFVHNAFEDELCPQTI